MAEELVATEEASEITTHMAAYHKFTLLVKWMMVLAGSMLLFLGIWFAADDGFFPGLIVGLIVFGLGSYALRHGWAHSSEEGSVVYPQAQAR